MIRTPPPVGIPSQSSLNTPSFPHVQSETEQRFLTQIGTSGGILQGRSRSSAKAPQSALMASVFHGQMVSVVSSSSGTSGSFGVGDPVTTIGRIWIQYFSQ